MEEFSPVTPDYAQRAVGMSWQSDPGGSYAEGDEIAVEVSSLLFSTDEPMDEVLQAELAGFPVGEFEIDDTVIDGTDEVGQASVAFDVPAEATDVAEGRETSLVLTAPKTGTTVSVPVTLEAADDDDDDGGDDGTGDDGTGDDDTGDDGGDDGTGDDGTGDDGTGDDGTGDDGTGDDRHPDTGAGIGLLGLLSAGLLGTGGLLLGRRRLS